MKPVSSRKSGRPLPAGSSVPAMYYTRPAVAEVVERHAAEKSG